jgi:hypothetical protein
MCRRYKVWIVDRNEEVGDADPLAVVLPRVDECLTPARWGAIEGITAMPLSRVPLANLGNDYVLYVQWAGRQWWRAEFGPVEELEPRA